MPKWQSFDDFLTAVAFPPEDASAVVTSAGDCFKAARSIAADLLRRGETLAAERKSGASAAPAAESKARGKCWGIFACSGCILHGVPLPQLSEGENSSKPSLLWFHVMFCVWEQRREFSPRQDLVPPGRIKDSSYVTVG